MAALTFEQARQSVVSQVLAAVPAPDFETVEIGETLGRVLAEPVVADRDLPPTNRSLRDGFAVYSADLPGELRVAGEVRAGATYTGELEHGEAIEIMTGAPVPFGADAVVMVEHVERHGDTITSSRVLQSGENINPRGAEAHCGDTVLKPEIGLNYAAIAALAAVGKVTARVYRRPRVAIVSTGDEVVSLHERPLDFQVRNSNAYSLAAQVRMAGGEPLILPVARDEWESTRLSIGEGLKADLLLVSGGVSAGKYDIVERALASVGADFFFDRVLIQPGQPLVFGRAQGKFFFGLPGNPASTMVTFQLFARAAVEILSGLREPSLPLLWTRLSQGFTHKPGLTRFLPARLSPDGSQLTPVSWRGSSDIPALARANAFLVASQDREAWEAGDWIQVLPQ